MATSGAADDSGDKPKPNPESQMNPSAATSFQLRYRSYAQPESGFSFPCDARGHVDLDALSDRARNNYLYARAMVGKELDVPAVEAALH
jgi:hypothetical protein